MLRAILTKPAVNRTKQDIYDLLVPLLVNIEFFKEREMSQESELVDIAKCMTYEHIKRG